MTQKTCKTAEQATRQAVGSRRQKPWSEKEQDIIRERSQWTHELLEQLAEPHATTEAQAAAVEARKAQQINEEWAKLQAEAISLNPGQEAKFEGLMARRFGMVMDTFGLGSNKTTAGSVRMSLIDARRTAEGLVDIVGKWRTHVSMKEARAAVMNLSKKKGLTPAQGRELFQEVMEVGNTPTRRKLYGNSETVNNFLDARLDQHYANIKALGIDEHELDSLVAHGLKVASSFDEVGDVAKAMGVLYDPVANMGYFARKMKEDARMKLDLLSKRLEQQGVAIPGVGRSRHQQRRSTNWLLAEDYKLLSDMLNPDAAGGYRKFLKENGVNHNVIEALTAKLTKGKRNTAAAKAVEEATGVNPERLKDTVPTKDELLDAVAEKLGMARDEYNSAYDNARDAWKEAKETIPKTAKERYAKAHGVDDYDALYGEVADQLPTPPSKSARVDELLAKKVGMTVEEYKAFGKSKGRGDKPRDRLAELHGVPYYSAARNAAEKELPELPTKAQRVKEALAERLGMTLDEYNKIGGAKPPADKFPGRQEFYAELHGLKNHDEYKKMWSELRTELQEGKLGMTLQEYGEKVKEARKATRGDRAYDATADEVDEAIVNFIKEKNPDAPGLVNSLDDLHEMRDQFIKEAGGLTAHDLDKMMTDDPMEFLSNLHRNLTPEQLDSLVDAGVLSEVPMTSPEVVRYFVKQYQLPYSAADDVFELDVPKLFDGYVADLRKAAGDSAIIKKLVEDGQRKGWTVTSEEVAANPVLYKNFKAVNNIGLDRLQDMISPEIFAGFKGVHVHPIVYDQLEGLINISTNPGAMSQVGQVFHFFNKFLATNALLSGGAVFLGVPYVAKQAYSNIRQLIAGGGHLHRIISVANKFIKVQRFGLEALDDTKPFIKSEGEWLTQREAFKQMLIMRGHQAVPLGLGETAETMTSISPKAFAQGFKQVIDYGMMFGDPIKGTVGAMGYAGKKLERAQNRLFSPFAQAAGWMDTIFKIAGYESVLEVDGVSDYVRKAHSFVSARHDKKSIREAVEHFDNYFIDYANLGGFQQGYGKYLRPFASFAMQNPPMQFRHAMRNPAEFMAYMRLASTLREEHRNPEQTEAGYSKYELEDWGHHVAYDPKTKRAVTLFTANFDPTLDSLMFAREVATKAQRISGRHAGSGWEQREDLNSPYTMTELVRDMVGKNTNEIWKTVSESITSKDAETGQELDKGKTTLLGMEVGTEIPWLLSKFPFVAALDRTLGGRPRVEDIFGKQEAPAVPGLLGTPQGKASRSQRAQYLTEQSIGRTQQLFMQAAGIRIKTIDIKEGNYYTFKDIENTHSKLGRTIQDKARLVRDSLNGASNAEKQKSLQELELLRAQYVALSSDVWRVRKWMKEHVGVSGEEVLKILEKTKDDTYIRDIPVPSPVMDKIINEQLTQHKELVRDAYK